ncbi:cathepsin L-like proteinase [Diabrotica virgifera virgifera]|uniref:Cathepsin L-like proteinase n=1 Tax=Diabrotica virgifera virgifera TaxID=50390 RepID=A0A6P7G7V7_DIAVI|nr:cathepsin L-like proteinase [Diabrotica virgifera virgifera]
MLYKYFLVVFSLYVMANALSDEEQFAEFKQKFQKSYGSKKEEQYRFETFQKNLRYIENHNQKFVNEEVTYSMAVNEFSDQSADEWATKFHGLIPQENYEP